jgi:hypothetical protein
MDRQQSGNDAEIGAEIWDPIHLRFTARPGVSPAAISGYLLSLDLDQQSEPLFSLHAAPQKANGVCSSVPQSVL